MPLNRNMTFVPETFTIHFRDEDGNVIQEETMPLEGTVEFHTQDEPIHREDIHYVRFNPNTEATFTATNAVVNEELLYQIEIDDTVINEPEKELVDVDPDEFDKILSV